MALYEMVWGLFHEFECANPPIFTIIDHPFDEIPVETLRAAIAHIRSRAAMIFQDASDYPHKTSSGRNVEENEHVGA
jgi:hypothetical protein